MSSPVFHVVSLSLLHYGLHHIKHLRSHCCLPSQHRISGLFRFTWLLRVSIALLIFSSFHHHAINGLRAIGCSDSKVHACFAITISLLTIFISKSSAQSMISSKSPKAFCTTPQAYPCQLNSRHWTSAVRVSSHHPPYLDMSYISLQHHHGQGDQYY
ncbi:hypothetical protein P692DRAFT_201170800 [Suillus brevipes Sb2]|nr:hypothetical protein P692DRAFT_201170800 [Suillus brevipes Sb2]